MVRRSRKKDFSNLTILLNLDRLIILMYLHHIPLVRPQQFHWFNRKDLRRTQEFERVIINVMGFDYPSLFSDIAIKTRLILYISLSC
jgi:hypothetical protein